MYTKKDMEQMLYGLLEDLVSKEQPKIIEESKEEPLTEYQKELLQSISEAKKPQQLLSRLDIPPTAIKRIFGESSDLVKRIKQLDEFVKGNFLEDSSPPASQERLLWYINILTNLVLYVEYYKDNASSLGFEMEHFLAALVGGRVLPATEANAKGEDEEAGDVTDVEVKKTKTAYSLKTLKGGTDVTGSIANLNNSLQKYESLYYILFLKTGAGIDFYNLPLKENGGINTDNIGKMGLSIDENSKIYREPPPPKKNKKKKEDATEETSTQPKTSTQFKSTTSNKSLKQNWEMIGSISLGQIKKTIGKISNEFVQKNRATVEKIKEASNQVVQFQKHLMKNPKEGQNNLNNAITAMAEATSNIKEIISIKYGTPDTEQGNNQQ